VRRNVERIRPKLENAKVRYFPWRKQQRTEDTLFTIFAERQRTRNFPRGEWLLKIHPLNNLIFGWLS
jgi:hypothetical protein